MALEENNYKKECLYLIKLLIKEILFLEMYLIKSVQEKKLIFQINRKIKINPK